MNEEDERGRDEERREERREERERESEKERRRGRGMKMRRGCPRRSLVHLAARPRVTLNSLTSVASRYRFASNYAHVTTRNKYLPILRSLVV